MDHPLRSLVALLGAISASSCYAQSSGLPVGWIEANPPAQEIRDGNSLACANYSRHEWKVVSTLSGLQVLDDRDQSSAAPIFPPHFTLSKEMRGRPVTLKTSDGWLVGFDAGEFGGGLWWSSEDGRRVRRLLEDNVHSLVSHNRTPLVLTGLAHMGSDQGAIYAYHPSETETSGSLMRLADLGSSPGAASVAEDGTLYVVTHKNIMRFGTDGVVEPLYASGALSALYPNSIVLQTDGRIFVGMRFYVLELLPRNGILRTAKWFVTPKCRTTKIENFDCVCIAGNTP